MFIHVTTRQTDWGLSAKVQLDNSSCRAHYAQRICILSRLSAARVKTLH